MEDVTEEAVKSVAKKDAEKAAFQDVLVDEYAAVEAVVKKTLSEKYTVHFTLLVM